MSSVLIAMIALIIPIVIRNSTVEEAVLNMSRQRSIRKSERGTSGQSLESFSRSGGESKLNDIEYIVSRLTTSDLLVQLAEEADELGQAVGKCYRHSVGRNLPSKDEEECWKNLHEEIADILLVCSILGINPLEPDIIEIMCYKKSRWAKRLKAEEDNHDSETL